MSDLFSVSGKAALVTGGAKGLGYMIAEGLVDAGARVYLCGRDEDAGKRAEARLRMSGGRVRFLKADVTIQEDLKMLHRELFHAEHDGLHILVNNAGITATEPLDTFRRETFEQVLSANLIAPFMLVQAMLPLLRTAGTRDEPASIVNITSVAALAPSSTDNYGYHSGKAGLGMLTRHLALQLSKENIRVNAIAPGFFPSEMSAYLLTDEMRDISLSKIPIGRFGRSDDLAAAVIYLSSRAGAYLAGVTLPLTGGLITSTSI